MRTSPTLHVVAEIERALERGQRFGVVGRERLHSASPEVRAWWPRHEVAPLSSGTKRLRHQRLGELELSFVTLQVADDPEQKLVTFAASAADQRRIAELITAA